ncbi:hypothetical protein NQZ68_003244 [Dissostichus eleginoides]|nr:hypothetical protein NQZ68_003244 [Dissostichus eleginoides]
MLSPVTPYIKTRAAAGKRTEKEKSEGQMEGTQEGLLPLHLMCPVAALLQDKEEALVDTSSWEIVRER